MVNSSYRKNILCVLAVLLLVFLSINISSCASSAGKGAGEASNTGKATDPGRANTGKGGNAGKAAPAEVVVTPSEPVSLGKLQIHFVDPVTLSLTASEVHISHDVEKNFALDITLAGGIVYKQIWDTDAKELLYDAVSRYSIDQNSDKFKAADANSSTAYGTMDGYTEWEQAGKTFYAEPPVDLGYIISGGKSYFLITQRSSVSAEDASVRSARIVFCIDMEHARQLVYIFGGKLYEKPLMLFIGDGVTAGPDDNDVPPNALFPAILQKMLTINIINFGEEWLTTDMVNEEYLQNVMVYDPDVVVINLGFMDFLDRVPPQETSRNIQAIINLFKKTGRKIFLTRFYDAWILQNNMVNWDLTAREQNNLVAEYDTVFRNLARNNNIDLITNIWDGLQYEDTIDDDYIYPNAEGHKLMAGNFFRAMRPFMTANNYLK